jgi:NPCBM/NEW2 domain
MRLLVLAALATSLFHLHAAAPGPRALLPGEPAAADIARARAMLEAWENDAPEKAPRVLRLCYWTPADRDPREQYRARLTRVMTHIRDFYSREMAAWGLPGRTIQLEFAADGLLQIHEVKGALKSEECTETDPSDGQAIRRDCLRVLRDAGLDGDKETIVIFCNLAEWDPEKRKMSHHSPYYASGDSRRGTAWQVDSPLLDSALLGVKDQHITDGQYGRISLGKYNSIFVGGVCHELGHALGLPHCRESAACRPARGTALMGGGNRTYGDELRGEGHGSFLTLAHALKLAAHPQFSGSVKELATKAEAAFSDWQLTPGADGLRITGRVKANLPVHAVLAYADPEGGGDYDSEIAAAIPASDGAFSLHLPRAQRKDRAASLRFVGVCVNGAATAGNWAANALSLRARITADGAYDVAPAIEQLELRAHLDSFLKGTFTDTQLAALSPRVQAALRRLKTPNSTDGKPQPAAVAADITEMPLSGTAPLTAQTGWGGVHFDRTGEGRPLEGPAGLFTHGLYAHADSRFDYQLDGKWDTLTGIACVLDGGFGTVEALIEADGRSVWGPKTIKPGEQAPFEIAVRDVKKLTLRFTGKDGNRGAWSAWAEPSLTRAAGGK